MKGLIFESQEACEATLEQIRLTCKQEALDAGMTMVVKNGAEMIVSRRGETGDPDAVGTYRWDVPHRAEGVQAWYCASPAEKHPDILATLQLEEEDIPTEWLPSALS